jgi:hypothetical protein
MAASLVPEVGDANPLTHLGLVERRFHTDHLAVRTSVHEIQLIQTDISQCFAGSKPAREADCFAIGGQRTEAPPESVERLVDPGIDGMQLDIGMSSGAKKHFEFPQSHEWFLRM